MSDLSDKIREQLLDTVNVLSEEEKRVIVKVYKKIYATNRLFTPNFGMQAKAYNSKATEIFYGGGVGGGKTMLAIGMSLTKHYHTLFLKGTKGQFSAVRTDYENILIREIKNRKATISAHEGVKFYDKNNVVRYVKFLSLFQNNSIKGIHGGSYDSF